MIGFGNVGLNFKVVRFINAEVVDDNKFGHYLTLTVMVCDDLGNKYNITVPHIYKDRFSLGESEMEFGDYCIKMELRNEVDCHTGFKSAFKIEKVEENNPYNLGDTVLVKTDLLVGNKYGNGLSFTKEMEKFKGVTAKIHTLYTSPNMYKLDIDNENLYSEEMLEKINK